MPNKQIEYAVGTVSNVVIMGQNGGGYITIEILKSFGKRIDSMSQSQVSQLRLDLIEGVEMGDNVKLIIEVEK